MGDFRDMHDLSLFARSPEGEAVLEEIRHQLEGRTIEKVSFSNEVNYVATTLELDDGSTVFIMQPSLEIGAIREQFEEVLDRQEEVEPLDLSESKRSK